MKASFYHCNKTFEIDPVTPAADEVQVDVARRGLRGNMGQRIGCRRIIGHEMSGAVAALAELEVA